LRDVAIYGEHEHSDLAFRIGDDWKVSLEYDKVLVKEIDRLVQ
jgi:hypothetical protein